MHGYGYFKQYSKKKCLTHYIIIIIIITELDGHAVTVSRKENNFSLEINCVEFLIHTMELMPDSVTYLTMGDAHPDR